MQNNIPESYFFQEKDMPLVQMTHTFSSASIWLAKGMDKQITTFDLVVRDFKKRNYMLACGLEEMLSYLNSLRFSDSDIDYLSKLGIISEECEDYLRKFQFTGTVYAMPEGTPFFPSEPIVRITAPIIEASLIEMALIGIATSNVPFLTKATRIVLSTQNKFSVSTGLIRSHSFESGIKASRAGYIAGMVTSIMPIITKKYNIKTPRPVTSGQHFFIKSFPSEIEAMEAMAEFAPNNASFVVDTYDMKQGIENAIKVAKKIAREGYKLFGIFIDSGDLVHWSKYARKELDKNRLRYVKIFLGSNLDEYKIANLANSNTPCDVVALATEYMTLSDSPKLEVVYKIAEIRDRDRVVHVAKLTPGKLSLPGRKQVFRVYKENGKFKKDVIGLDDENFGKPLLIKVMEKGHIIYNFPTLDEIKEYTSLQIKKLPMQVLDIEKDYLYGVCISDKIKKILDEIRGKHVATK